MPRARALTIVVLLLSYGAVGARQPAVRTSVPLGVSAATLAEALGVSPDRSRILVDIVRVVFDSPDGQDEQDTKLRATLNDLLRLSPQKSDDTVPLPLDPAIWRETLVRQQVPDRELIAAIMSDRRTALLYHGLAALDDETLAWLGPDRDTLSHLLKRPTTFAVFAGSLRVHAGRIVVPGGTASDRLWQALVGADPAEPGPFTRRLFSQDNATLAYFYDTVAHLDPPRQRFALGATLPAEFRADRVRALLDAVGHDVAGWLPHTRPFMRPQIDAALLLTVFAATDEGRPIGPMTRDVWDVVFRGDGLADVDFRENQPSASEPAVPVDAAWLASRTARITPAVARRRMDAWLFSQRVFPVPSREQMPAIVTALRGFMAFPALMLTLERAGVRSPDVFVRAAVHAQALDAIRGDAARRAAVLQFQSAVAIIERGVRWGALSGREAGARLDSLFAVQPSPEHGYDGRIAGWIVNDLVNDIDRSTDAPIETAVLSMMSGIRSGTGPPPVVEWEGRKYRVDPPRAEFIRLRRVRERQGSDTLDAALALMQPHRAERQAKGERPPAERALAETLATIVYAASLGDPRGPALEAGNVALRHVLGTGESAWRLPVEQFGSRAGWHVIGSLLGLDSALRRLALRRLDAGDMPAEPHLSTNERQTAMLTVALLSASSLTDAARDQIAAALARGRARVAALSGDRDELERVVADAGVGEWRRESIAWAVANERDQVENHFSIVELMRLGAPDRPLSPAFDPWGAAMLPLTGCLCVAMPPRVPWEVLAGRPAAGLLATYGAEVSLNVADHLAALHLPASLTASVVALAMQDVIDRARTHYFDDWIEFSEAARALSRDEITDYIAALTANGPLVPAEESDGQRR